MTGEREFAPWCKDPCFCSRCPVGGRQEKHRFRKIEFGGEPLHRFICKAVRFRDDGQRITLKRRGREDIEKHVFVHLSSLDMQNAKCAYSSVWKKCRSSDVARLW